MNESFMESMMILCDPWRGKMPKAQQSTWPLRVGTAPGRSMSSSSSESTYSCILILLGTHRTLSKSHSFPANDLKNCVDMVNPWQTQYHKPLPFMDASSGKMCKDVQGNRPTPSCPSFGWWLVAHVWSTVCARSTRCNTCVFLVLGWGLSSFRP